MPTGTVMGTAYTNRPSRPSSTLHEINGTLCHVADLDSRSIQPEE
jgi:hypothetical protein